MNCYSCPGALAACPVGAMQAVLDARHRRFAFYVAGYLATIGLVIGRFVCGWLCLFGIIQELLYKIPTRKLNIPQSRIIICGIVRLVDVDEGKCVHCGSCSSVCHMNVDPAHTPNSPECIRCGACINACPVDAIKYCVFGKKQRKGEKLSDRFI